MSEANITKSTALQWNQYEKAAPEHALPRIYEVATSASQAARNWYWTSIRRKKSWSVPARVASYTMAIGGVAGPLLAALLSASEDRLVATQLGVISLALAGLIQLGDRVFGWSGGWLRYITTVTALERIAVEFELDWATYVLSRPNGLQPTDVKPLFELARALQVETERLREEETKAWVVDFNAGMAALNEMLKAQKDASEKSADTARSAVSERNKPRLKGALQVVIEQRASPLKEVTVWLDDDEQKHTFVGSAWSFADIEPGHHTVQAVTDAGKPGMMQSRQVVDVPPGAVLLVTLKLP